MKRRKIKLLLLITNNVISQSFDQILSLWKSMLVNECLNDNLGGDENELAADSF
jgi:hypothetical protein